MDDPAAAHDEPVRPSLLMWGAGQRLAVAGVALLGLWLGVAWALGA
jgi:hypothetical protein